METVNEPVRLLEIERELSGPNRQEALVRYDRILLALSNRIDAALKEGVAPDQFQKVELLRDANIVARKILRLAVRVDDRV